MQTINVKVKEHSLFLRTFFPKWVDGVTVGRTIHLRKKATDYAPKLLNHETIHVVQYEKYGIIRFLFNYFIRDFKKSYREKEYEIEAYANESNLNYVQETYGVEVTYIYK